MKSPGHDDDSSTTSLKHHDSPVLKKQSLPLRSMQGSSSHVLCDVDIPIFRTEREARASQATDTSAKLYRPAHVLGSESRPYTFFSSYQTSYEICRCCWRGKHTYHLSSATHSRRRKCAKPFDLVCHTFAGTAYPSVYFISFGFLNSSPKPCFSSFPSTRNSISGREPVSG